MEYDSKYLSKQLRCPADTEARQIGENMFQSNCNMTFETIKALNIRSHTKVFEIGYGNGMHLSFLFEKDNTLIYKGIDISQALLQQKIITK